MSTIKAAWLIPSDEMSIIFRTAYGNYVRSILNYGEDVPYSIHLKATEHGCCEVRAMIMNIIVQRKPNE